MVLQLNQKRIKIIFADTFTKRLQGLMGVSPISYGMFFPHCNAIHTFFMKETIDVVGLNEKNEVIYLYQNLPKNQIIRIPSNMKKTSILELPANTSKSISLGDVLLFEDEDVI